MVTKCCEDTWTRKIIFKQPSTDSCNPVQESPHPGCSRSRCFDKLVSVSITFRAVPYPSQFAEFEHYQELWKSSMCCVLFAWLLQCSLWGSVGTLLGLPCSWSQGQMKPIFSRRHGSENSTTTIPLTRRIPHASSNLKQMFLQLATVG